ncbi:hypothetical protein D9M69_690950 [compost metagenome]
MHPTVVAHNSAVADGDGAPTHSFQYRVVANLRAFSNDNRRGSIGNNLDRFRDHRRWGCNKLKILICHVPLLQHPRRSTGNRATQAT